MFPLIFLMATTCSGHDLTLAEAKGRVLAAPNIKGAIARRKAQPFFETVTEGPRGWDFTIKARNPCAGPGPCSNLLGHYAVERKAGKIWDMDKGEDGELIAAPRPLRSIRSC